MKSIRARGNNFDGELFKRLRTWARSKVAVLDAIVQKGIDGSVVVPVTEKVMGCLVVSGRFTVLDRANVEKVLREREFQVSGLVSDAEITEAGKYLGADFVVVIKVQRLAATYFLGAKMIPSRPDKLPGLFGGRR